MRSFRENFEDYRLECLTSHGYMFIVDSQDISKTGDKLNRCNHKGET